MLMKLMNMLRTVMVLQKNIVLPNIGFCKRITSRAVIIELEIAIDR